MRKNDLNVKKLKKRNTSSDFLNGYFSLFWILGLFLREKTVTKSTGLEESSKYGHTVTCICPWVFVQFYPVFKPGFQPVTVEYSVFALSGAHYLNVFGRSQHRLLHKSAGFWPQVSPEHTRVGTMPGSQSGQRSDCSVWLGASLVAEMLMDGTLVPLGSIIN